MSGPVRDWVFIRDLQVETLIGAFAWERQIRQSVSLDLELATDIRPAAASDRLADALDYKRVAKRVLEFAGSAEYELVESLAEAIAALIMREFGVPELRLSLNKTGALRGARDVGVRIHRRLTDGAGS